MVESEAQLYQKLLVDALHGDVDAVKVAFDNVRQLRAPYLDPLQPVAVIGARKGHMAVMRFALDRGARYDRNLCLAVSQGSKVSAEVPSFYEENKVAFDEKIDARDPKKGLGATISGLFHKCARREYLSVVDAQITLEDLGFSPLSNILRIHLRRRPFQLSSSNPLSSPITSHPATDSHVSAGFLCGLSIGTSL